MKIGVSACLLGENVTWRGNSNYCQELIELLKGHEVIKICPEVQGGLSIPRHPSEITSFKPYTIVNDMGENNTKYFVKGANKAYNDIRDVDFVILKAKSPSCGNIEVYDGTFSHQLIDGEGVFAHLCKQHQLKVFNELQLDLIKTFLKEKL